MADDRDPVSLTYAVPRRPRHTRHVDGAFVSTVCFVVTFFTLEVVTSNLMLFRFDVLGHAEPGTYAYVKLCDRQLYDLIAEFMGGGLAAAAVFVTQLLMPAAGSDRWWGSWQVPLAAVYGAAYCWLRWGIWLGLRRANVSYPESADFTVAMSLAVGVGGLLGVGRRLERRR